jgi:hypothetical protein
LRKEEELVPDKKKRNKEKVHKNKEDATRKKIKSE